MAVGNNTCMLSHCVVIYEKFSLWVWLMHTGLFGIEGLFCTLLLDILRKAGGEKLSHLSQTLWRSAGRFLTSGVSCFCPHVEAGFFSARGLNLYERSSISELCQASLEPTESHVLWSLSFAALHLLIDPPVEISSISMLLSKHPKGKWRRAIDWLDRRHHSEAWSKCGQCQAWCTSGKANCRELTV